ncbi:hypothetical protein [Spirosoma koreense]
MKRRLISFLVFLGSLPLPDSTILEAAAVALSAYAFLTFIHRIGDRIALPECIGCIAALEILLVPAITYWVFPASMPIGSANYFRYALPAFVAFYIGLNWVDTNRLTPAHRLYFQRVRSYLKHRTEAGNVLFLIGLGGFGMKMILPDAPTFLTTLPSHCLFVSVFYAVYSRSRSRLLIVHGAIGVLLTYTVRAGMFGDLFFWLMLMTIFGTASLPNPLTTRLKTGFVLAAFVLLLLIQSVKGEYRYNTWGYYRGERSGNAALMGDLIVDRLRNPEKLFSADHFFLSFVRFNQGIMIGSAMTKVPTHEAFARGEVLLSFVYPFVPRFIWPGKPQTGGYANIHRFTSLPQSENTSMNISPLGEGYVNFGYGGIVFAGFYGWLLGRIFRYVLWVSARRPSVVLWLPVLYLGCLTMETDILSTWGSLVNNALFMILLYGVLRRVGIQL